jgi:Nucleotidyl transferase AbiEii toxin, Type IV TA system
MNRPLTTPEIIEYFHLAFLRVLQGRLNQRNYVLKGGANLRYFFQSVRFSEDIDLDAAEIEPWNLARRVDQVLGSPGIRLLLRNRDLTLETVSLPKQTDTTQRWKLSIVAGGRRGAVHTKIEFRHGHPDPRRTLDAVPERVVGPYSMQPPTLLHYTGNAAIEQKIKALASRNEPQARDVFDLDLLLRRPPDSSGRIELDSEVIKRAGERAIELSFAAFQDQVVPFLDPDAIELYNSPGSWEQMQSFVAERMDELG